jgi:crotonobetainyl-CoA:carnitine CoA-transferase CaiB-like acyl-CoA transferase
MVQEVDHPTAGRVRLVGIPVKFSDSPGQVTQAPPLLGQHTAEVLGALLGLSSADVDELKREGVV